MRKMILLLLFFIFLYCSDDSESPTQQQNHAPNIISITASPSSVPNYEGSINRKSTIAVVALDEDEDELTYTFSCVLGTLSGQNNNQIIWTAPRIIGDYVVKCIVSDGKTAAIDSVVITVVPLFQ